MLLIVSLIIVSCESENEITGKTIPYNGTADSISNTIESMPFETLIEIKIEGCEYFIYKGHYDSNEAFGLMTHKGNCSNPIHENK